MDSDQYFIASVNYFVGNPHLRQTLEFSVTFSDGTTIMKRFTPDLTFTGPYLDFISRHKILLPLRFNTARAAQQYRSQRLKLAITDFQPNQNVYIDLRIFDSIYNTWFDSKELPHKDKIYVFDSILKQFANSTHTRICALAPVFNIEFTGSNALTMYDFETVVYTEFDATTMIEVTKDLMRQYPQLNY